MNTAVVVGRCHAITDVNDTCELDVVVAWIQEVVRSNRRSDDNATSCSSNTKRRGCCCLIIIEWKDLPGGARLGRSCTGNSCSLENIDSSMYGYPCFVLLYVPRSHILVVVVE